MSYAPVGPVFPVGALGWTGTIKVKTPVGTENASITVPIEQAVDYAMSRAESKMNAMLPGLMDQALNRAGGYVTEELWPQMQPKLRIEVDRAMQKADNIATETKDDALTGAAILGGVLVLTIAGAAWWTGRKK